MTANRPSEWTHIGQMPRFCANSREISKLQIWGMVQEKSNHNTAKRTSGVWRTTVLGEEFARGIVFTASHAFVLSPGNRLLGFEESLSTIRAVLGKNFDYHELMRGEG
jgi:hypothetical protein